MSIEVIPAGASAVVTDSYKNEHSNRQQERWVELMEAIKDAQAQDVETTKDAEAHIVELVKDAEADGVRTTKDTEANLERSLSSATQNVIQDIKDAETRLGTEGFAQTMNVIQDIKDAETRLTKDLNDNFIQTIQDVKLVGNSVRDNASHTRESMDRNFRETTRELYSNFERTNKYVDDTRREVSLFQERALKEDLVTQYKLHNENDRRHYETQKEMLKGFSESELRADRHAAAQALLSERLAAQAAAKAAECCCEIKEKITADGQKTRDLINSITEQNLRDRAAKAEAGLAAYFAAKVAPTVPVV